MLSLEPSSAQLAQAIDHSEATLLEMVMALADAPDVWAVHECKRHIYQQIDGACRQVTTTLIATTASAREHIRQERVEHTPNVALRQAAADLFENCQQESFSPHHLSSEPVYVVSRMLHWAMVWSDALFDGDGIRVLMSLERATDDICDPVFKAWIEARSPASHLRLLPTVDPRLRQAYAGFLSFSPAPPD